MCFTRIYNEYMYNNKGTSNMFSIENTQKNDLLKMWIYYIILKILKLSKKF